LLSRHTFSQKNAVKKNKKNVLTACIYDHITSIKAITSGNDFLDIMIHFGIHGLDIMSMDIHIMAEAALDLDLP
jgi:hypothetical protein